MCMNKWYLIERETKLKKKEKFKQKQSRKAYLQWMQS